MAITITTKDFKLGLQQQKIIFHKQGGERLSEGTKRAEIPWLLFMAYRRPTSWRLPLWACNLTLSLWGSLGDWIRHNSVASFYMNYLVKGPISTLAHTSETITQSSGRWASVLPLILWNSCSWPKLFFPLNSQLKGSLQNACALSHFHDSGD